MTKDAPTGTRGDTVVFVGPGWNCFEQLCGALHKEGVRTLWIGYPYGLASKIRTQLFTETFSAHTPDEVCERLRELGLDRVLDIVMPEFLAEELLPVLGQSSLPLAVRQNLAERFAWLPKDYAMRTLREAGIPVPGQVCDSGEGLDIDDAAEALGLPLVVKGTVSSGGSAVRICHDRDSARAMCDQIQAAGGIAFAEEFVDGEDGLCYAAAHAAGRVLAEASYAGVRDEGPNASPVELGPLDLIHSIDDPQLFDLGQRVIGCLAGAGATNIDVIRRPDGRLVVIDVNMRPFGPIVTLRGAGVDLAAGYAAALRGDLAGAGTPSASTAGVLLPSFPRRATNKALEQPVRGLRNYLREARPYLRWSGTGYVVAETIRVGRTVLTHQARRTAAIVDRHSRSTDHSRPAAAGRQQEDTK